MHASWMQTNASGKTLQKAEAKFNKKPLVVYANFTTNSNHYTMWIDHKNSYIQSQGTATNRWFKTKPGKTSSYAELTDSLAKSALMNFSSQSAKLFKVKKTANGYFLTYSGKNSKLWKEIIQNTMITSVIGIDQNTLKNGTIKMQIATDAKYNLTQLNVDAEYHESSNIRHLKMNIDQINKLPEMKIPNHIIKSAVNLGALSN